jgi:hypothetical protein
MIIGSDTPSQSSPPRLSEYNAVVAQFQSHRSSSLILSVVILFVKRVLVLMSLMLGVGLICAPRKAVSESLWADLVARGTHTVSELQPRFSHDTDTLGFTGIGSNDHLEAWIKIKVDHPRKVASGDSVPVRATIEVTKSKHIVSTKSAFTGDSTSQELPQSEATADADAWLKRMMFSLALAGAEVRPEGRNVLIDRTVTWSIMPKAAGKLTGVVTPEAENFFEAVSHIDGDRSFTIEAFENPFATTKALSWVPKVLGALLTVPGMLAFLREYRERRNVLLRSREQERRIIL